MSRGGGRGRTGVRDYCVAILAKHAGCFLRYGDDRQCRSHASKQATGRGATVRDAEGGRCLYPGLELCSGILVNSPAGTVQVTERRRTAACWGGNMYASGDGAWKSLSIGTAGWILRYLVMVPWRPDNHDGMGVKALEFHTSREHSPLGRFSRALDSAKTNVKRYINHAPALRPHQRDHSLASFGQIALCRRAALAFVVVKPPGLLTPLPFVALAPTVRTPRTSPILRSP